MEINDHAGLHSSAAAGAVGAPLEVPDSVPCSSRPMEPVRPDDQRRDGEREGKDRPVAAEKEQRCDREAERTRHRAERDISRR